jgi:hypothetical protein
MYLYHPPPIARVHLVIDTAAALVTCIVSLWGEHQMFHKSRIAIESSDGLHNVPTIEFEIFISNLELLALESRPAFHIIVENVIQFVDIVK